MKRTVSIMFLALGAILMFSCGHKEPKNNEMLFCDTTTASTVETVDDWWNDIYSSYSYSDRMIEVNVENKMMILYELSPVIVEWGDIVKYNIPQATTHIEIDGYMYTGVTVNFLKTLGATDGRKITQIAENRKSYFDISGEDREEFDGVIVVPLSLAESIKKGERALLFLDTLKNGLLCGVKVRKSPEYLDAFPFREDGTLIVDASKYDKDHDGDFMVAVMGAFDMANHLMESDMVFEDGITIEVLESYLSIENFLELKFIDKIAIREEDLWRLDYYGIDWEVPIE